jgi:D-proline reductase (dithiol) PrdB
MCHQSVGLIQSVIEKSGIATVSVTMLPEISRRVAPPRVLAVDYPFGYPLGAPNDRAVQTSIILAALRLLNEDPGTTVP